MKQFTCGSKVQYPLLWIATIAAYRHTEFRNKEYDPYYCKYCDKYHIGRRNDIRRPPLHLTRDML
jgi:hypothetical protein